MKKKKHLFLKILLCIVLVVALFIGAKLLCNKLAYKELTAWASDYPFEFVCETDSAWYVTDNFMVPLYYVNDKGKEINVEWTSSNENVLLIKDGEVIVKRPANTTCRVTLTEIHKKLLGKAEIRHTVTVIPTNSLDISDVDVITVEKLRMQEYNRDMQAVLDENGELDYMLGDFKDTYVYSFMDAAVILEAYREEFNTPKDVVFAQNKVVEAGINRQYSFLCYYGDYQIEGACAYVVVNADTSRVVKISIDVPDIEFENPSGSGEVDYESIIREYGDKTQEVVIFDGGRILHQGKPVQVVHCFYENGAVYEAYIDLNTCEVVKYETAADTADYTMEECIAVDDFDNEFTFEAAYNGKKYFLYDTKRKIHAFDNKGYWDFIRAAEEYANEGEPGVLGKIFIILPAALQKMVAKEMNFEISSKSKEFEEGSYARAYYNIQLAYDWYKDYLGLISYDGQGTEITVLLNQGEMIDNAAWLNNEKIFVVNPVSSFQYSLGNHPEVMAHEYTHAVFGNLTSLSGEAGIEVCGLNEAYADIFGCIISKDSNWVIGENYDSDGNAVYIRDLNKINVDSDSYIQPMNGQKYSETYKDEYWQEEEHVIATVIGHVAYKMWTEGYFTKDDVADIWYNSLTYGYDDTSNFLTCRKNVIKAAQDLGYSTKQTDSIAYEFDLVEIFDSSYEITTPEFLNKADEPEEDSFETIKTKDKAVEGDPILDNTTTKEYVVVYSVAAMMFGDGEGFFIFEAGKDLSDEEMENVGIQLSEKFKEAYGVININGNDVKITYKQIPEFAMNIVKKFCVDSDDYLRNLTFEGIGIEKDKADGETEDIINTIMKYTFDFKAVKSTPYNFYDGLGLLE